jgi:hypothetical protein
MIDTTIHRDGMMIAINYNYAAIPCWCLTPQSSFWEKGGLTQRAATVLCVKAVAVFFFSWKKE